MKPKPWVVVKVPATGVAEPELFDAASR